MASKIPVELLISMFAGKQVAVERFIPNGVGTREMEEARGVCATIHENEKGVTIELGDGKKFDFIPMVVDDDSVEGLVNHVIDVQRAIRLA